MITPIGSSDETGYSVAIQSNDKIVVAGNSDNGSNRDFAVVRYNGDGSLDSSFNGTGKVTTPIGSGHDTGSSVAIQSDSKIVVAGLTASGTTFDIAVVRYNPDGSLDTSFNGTGKVMTGFGGNSYDVGNAVKIQSDGKIVVAGYSNFNGNHDFAVVRYKSDGTLDDSFNGTGKVTTPIGSSTDIGECVAIQHDGKIIVAGASVIGSGGDFAVVRYNGDGTLDTSFNGTGKLTTDVGGGPDEAHSVAIQSDGKLVLAGSSGEFPSLDFAVVRYTSSCTTPTVEITSVSRSGNGHFILSVLTSPNLTLTIQASPDLIIPFEDIGTATADDNGVFEYSDAGAVAQMKRFYRVTYP